MDKEKRKVVSAGWGSDSKSNVRAVKYTYSDGSETYKKGGTPAWRNNNPGNVRCSDYMVERGAIGCTDTGFSVFPDWETGDKAMARLLRKGNAYIGATIETAINAYAPEFDKKGRKINHTPEYIASVKKSVSAYIEENFDKYSEKYLKGVSKLNIDKNELVAKITDQLILGEMDETVFKVFRSAMKKVEKTAPGTQVEVSGAGKDRMYHVREPSDENRDKHIDHPSKYKLGIVAAKSNPIEFKVIDSKAVAPKVEPKIHPEDVEGLKRIERMLSNVPQEALERTKREYLEEMEKYRKKKARKSSSSGGTLRRVGDKIYRVNADGSLDGYVKAWD